jgi:hypothetical protein
MYRTYFIITPSSEQTPCSIVLLEKIRVTQKVQTAADPKIPASDIDIIFATTIGRNEILSSGILVLR